MMTWNKSKKSLRSSYNATYWEQYKFATCRMSLGIRFWSFFKDLRKDRLNFMVSSKRLKISLFYYLLMKELNFITIGDRNYFPIINLSIKQVEKIYPFSRFFIYDWGFTWVQGSIRSVKWNPCSNGNRSL